MVRDRRAAGEEPTAADVLEGPDTCARPIIRPGGRDTADDIRVWRGSSNERPQTRLVPRIQPEGVGLKPEQVFFDRFI